MAEHSTALERLTDFMVGLFAPRAAARRAHLRRIRRDVEYRRGWEVLLRARGYKAAETKTNKLGFPNADQGSADRHLIPSLPNLRARSRALCRDDGIGAGIIGGRVRNVVGTGARPRSKIKPAERARGLEAIWNERKDQLTPVEGLGHAARLRLIYQNRCEAGEIWENPVVDRAGKPAWIELIEAERVATPADAWPLDPKGRIVDGIEKDRNGRPVALWVAKDHPGELLTIKGEPPRSSLSVADFVRLPWDRVNHAKSRITRSGQTRGVPLLHASLDDVNDLGYLLEAGMKRLSIASSLALFIESGEDIDDLLQLTADASDYGYQLDQKIEPGMIFKLLPGEKISQLIPNFNAPDLEPFCWLYAIRIGASIGQSPQSVLHQWSGVNYSGARTIQLEDRLEYVSEQEDLDEQVLNWEWKVVMQDARLRGDPRAQVSDAEIAQVDWIHRGWKWVDPQKEAAATRERLNLGLSSLARECAELGYDVEEVMDEILDVEEAWAEKRKERGLAPAPLPGSSPMPAPAQAQEDDEDDDEGMRVLPGRAA